MSDSREIFTLHDALLRSLGEGVYGINPDGLCTFINVAALSLLGYREEEILGKDPHLLFHNRDENGRPNPRENCPAFLTMQDGVTRRTEEDFITKDSRRILVSITAAPILNGPRITGAVVVFQDMTEIRLIQGVAREGYEIQRAILDTSLASIVYLLDRHILWVNKRTEEMFGYTANEMQGMNTGLLYESSEDYLSLGREAYPRLAGGDTYSSERLMKRKDGSLFWCLLNGRLSDPKKPELGSVWTLNDIDELHHQKEAIKESEERYRQIFEINSAIKLIIDLETNRIVDANNAACLFYGYSKNELLNLKISDINCLSPEQIKVEMSLAAEQKRLFFEFRHRLASGEIRDVEVYSGPVLINGRKHLHSIIHDVTEKKKAESQLRLAAQVIASSAEGVTMTDHQGNILFVNRAFSQITGYTQEEVLGKNPSLLSSGRHSREFYQEMWEELTARGSWTGEIWNRKKDGTVYPEWLSISHVEGPDTESSSFVGIFSDISRLKAAEERIMKLANFDMLTGLPNRTLFADRTAQAISHCRQRKLPLAMIYVDIDFFKKINDTLGHRVGDDVIVAVSSRIKELMRPEDTIARIGGDECALLLVESSAETAATMAKKIISSFNTPLHTGGMDISLTLSIGITMFPVDGEDFETLFRNADTAMYRVKQEGKNSFRFYTAEMQDRAVRHWAIEVGLRDAISRNEISIHYQPQVSLTTGRVTGAEALARWHHPVLGDLHPAEFIPIAEESGSILALGELILRSAIRQAFQWIRGGISDFNIAVNISALQMRQPDFVFRIANILREEEFPPQNLELELTESLAMRDPELAIELIQELRRMGIKVAMDDFGTGYSSLSYLKKFNFSRLKIDRSFIQDIETNAESLAIVKAIVGICDSLEILTIAEGVETEIQMNLMRSLGCKETQGFFVAQPMPAEETSFWLREKRRK